MSLATALPTRRVLADTLPGGLVRDAVLVAGGTLVVGALAQIAVPLGFTPVPLSLGTFAALVVGASLGTVRGMLSVLLYAVAGLAGVGWFAGGASGLTPSFGYVLGFVVAAGVVGLLAERGADRRVASTLGLMGLGSVLIYACGVPWLMAATGMDLSTALAKGVLPFLVGDAVKMLLAAGLLPSAWRLVGRR